MVVGASEEADMEDGGLCGAAGPMGARKRWIGFGPWLRMTHRDSFCVCVCACVCAAPRRATRLWGEIRVGSLE